MFSPLTCGAVKAFPFSYALNPNQPKNEVKNLNGNENKRLQTQNALSHENIDTSYSLQLDSAHKLRLSSFSLCHSSFLCYFPRSGLFLAFEP